MTTSTIVQMAQVLTAVTAIAAIGVAVLVELRARKAFSAQLALQQSLVRPMIDVIGSFWNNEKALTIFNRGLGPAVLSKVTMKRNADVSSNAALLFKFSITKQVMWDTWYVFPEKSRGLLPGEQLVIVKLTDKQLKANGFTADEITTIMREWNEQVCGLSITIEYSDALGLIQPQYHRTFSDVGTSLGTAHKI